MAARSASQSVWRLPRLLGRAPASRSCRTHRRHDRRRLAAERLEPRALLAVSASVSGAELLIDLSEGGDTAALRVEGSSLAVREGTRSVGSFASSGINSIRVTGRADLRDQSLLVLPGGVLSAALSVNAGVEATVLATPIVTSGSVNVASARVTLGADVRSAGPQAYAGTVRVASDIVVDAGASEIRFAGPIHSTVGPRATLMEDLGAPYRLALAPGGKTLYASDAVSNFVYFVDLAAQELDTVDLGKSVGNVLLGPNGSRLYVANPFDDSVTVVDTTTRGVLATIPVVGTPEGMAMTAGGSSLFVANSSENSVAVVNTSTNRVTRTIPVAGNPTAVAVGADGRLWVASESLHRVSVYSLGPATLRAQIDVGRGPADIALSPDGTRAYVANNFDNTVSVIDTASAAVIATVGVGSGPTELAVSSDGRLVYVVNGFADNVSVIDAASLSVATTVPVGSLPVGIVTSADGKTTYVANLSSLSELGNDARSLTVRTTGLAWFTAPASTVDPLRALVVEGPRGLESAGQVTLSHDTSGALRANGTRITFNGGPVHYEGAAAAGWTAVAAERVGGVNTVVLRHASGHLHFWRLDDSWTVTSNDGWVKPGSMTFFNTEVAFDTDLDGDGLVTIESSGGTRLAYDPAGSLFANGTAVMFNGGPASYRGLVAAGWTPMAAEIDQGTNTVVLRHSSGPLHFWRMDADWKQDSNDGWVIPGTTAFFAAEVAFGTDLNDDGILTIETSGSTLFAYDRDGTLLVNGSPIRSNDAPVNYHGAVGSGWTAVAAERVGGVNTVVFRHSLGYLHYWRLDAAWNLVTSEGWVAIGSPAFFAAEAAFAADLDADGRRTIESAGGFVLSHDRTGVLRAHQASPGSVDPTGTVIRSSGTPLNYHGAAGAGWTVMAADLDGGVRTVVFRHSLGHLHFWRLDSGWNMLSSEGWIAPGSATYFATELAFGVDLNGDGRIGA